MVWSTPLFKYRETEGAKVWAGATGIFYGVANSLQVLGQTIVEIDTKLTELSKVLSSNTDFHQLMQDTVELANTYGRSLTEAQDSLIEFGKAGFEAEQALRMTNATLLGKFCPLL